MKQFKKRTIALVLASVITVAGSFAAENYKNSLMGLVFKHNSDGTVNMTLQTKANYDGNVSLIRKDPTTYLIMLPEFNSQAPTPDLKDVSSNIESVSVRTMPYTNSGNGYTKITIKAYEDTILTADKALYIPAAQPNALPDSRHAEEDITVQPHEEPGQEPAARIEEERHEPVYHEYRSERRSYETERNEPEMPQPRRENMAATTPVVKTPQAGTVPDFVTDTEPQQSGDSTEAFLLVLGIFFVLTASIYLFVRAKNKLAEIAGEQIVIEVDEPKEDKKPKSVTKKTKKIKNAIKNLDTKYKNPVSIPKNIEYTPSEPIDDTKEEVNIVDLDELYHDKTTSKTESDTSTISEEENQALEDFLSGFSFDEEAFAEENSEEETSGFDEEYYEKTIHNDNLSFTQDDTDRVNQLLNTEISDSTLRNIEEFAVSNPIKKIPTKQEILEDLVTTYAVSQNIIFTQEDVDALNKLINVEIDPDFLTDLRTNPERAEEMRAEIERQKDKPHKTSEILTLNVKDMLPDLSEALRKQGGRRIESEVKPVTVYYSEGYEYTKLSLDGILPDLSKEINNADAYVSKPSADIELVDTSYQVDKLKISNQLPNLEDVLKNPEKYEEPKQKPVIVDEEALLKNISNVQFKPFYDGSESFEIINEDDSNAPSVSDIQKEFSQFGNFEISNQDDDETPSVQDDYDDFESLYRNDFVDLDKQFVTEQPKENLSETNDNSDKLLEEIAVDEAVVNDESPAKPIKNKQSSKNDSKKDSAESLLNHLEKSREERATRKARIMLKKQEQQNSETGKKSEKQIQCILDDEVYTVVSSVEFINNIGCHLAKNENGYTVLGFVGNKLLKIKQYSALKSEKIQARISENLPDGGLRYIVRIGIHKFIVNVHKDNLEYVMDLC